MVLDDLRLRDPFVFVDTAARRYLLFGSTDPNTWEGPGTGFDYYTSVDLVDFEGPFPAFRPTRGFWGTTQFWAPEVFLWRGAYYMFASFAAAHLRRGTAILVAEKPEGPYRPHSDGAVTPRDWEALDGTLFVDPQGRPWMVFCHEWLQVRDGRICAMPLTPDLRRSDGPPTTLFQASAARWIRPFRYLDFEGLVTDGPWLHRMAGGSLVMLWASFGENQRYGLTQARSVSGDLFGPWEHARAPLFSDDGGHAMSFRDLNGTARIVLHAPNITPRERARLLAVTETSDVWLALA